MPIISIEEALGKPREDLFVARDQSVTIGPDRREYSKYFHNVNIKTFNDLKSLHLIPEKLEENKVRESIKLDEEEALKVARLRMEVIISDLVTQPRYDTQLKKVYSSIRKGLNTNLARLISDTYESGTPFESRKMSPILLDKQFNNLINIEERMKRLHGQIATIKDITISNNAKLSVDPNVDTLFAKNIRIHQGGKLIIRGSFLKIVCDSMEGNIP